MRIILADPHAEPCAVLRILLAEQPDFDLIGEANDSQSLLRQAKIYNPDLILVDGELPGISIRELIDCLHRLQPRPIVVVMSSHIEYGRIILNAGADAFISKDDDLEWLLEKLQHYARQLNKKRRL